jgi:hypothetical protein
MKLITKLNYKVTVLFTVFLAFSTEGIAQTIENDEQNETLVHPSKFERQAQFHAGMKGFYKLFYTHFNVTDAAYENKVKGTLVLTFNIEIDGSLSDIAVSKDLGYGLGEEAVRVLKKMPNWVPALYKGEPIRQIFALPIAINCTD